jgi:hypothetical protein
MIEMVHFNENHFRQDSTRPIVEHLPWIGTRTSTSCGECSFTARSPMTATSRILLYGQPASTIQVKEICRVDNNPAYKCREWLFLEEKAT